MHLKYKVHQDDYHSTIDAYGVQSVRGALDHISGEHANGYDVTNVTLDGAPLDLTPFCPRRLHTGESCPNRVALKSPSRPSAGHLATCITHDHEDRYNADTFAYKGD